MINKIIKFFSFSIPLAFLFLLGTNSAQGYQYFEWSGSNSASAGQIETVPEGYALTAIGYGSDDHDCNIYLRTAPVNADGTVDFAQADGGWSNVVVCGKGVKNNTPTAQLSAPDNQVITGWSWGANTSGGDRTSDTSPPDECYYQEYMNLQTKQVFGWASQFDGTCAERGYFYTPTYDNLKGIARAPQGRVIVGIRFAIEDDAKITWMGITTNEVNPKAVLDAYIDSPGQTQVSLTYDKTTQVLSPAKSLTVANVGPSGSKLDWAGGSTSGFVDATELSGANIFGGQSVNRTFSSFLTNLDSLTQPTSATITVRNLYDNSSQVITVNLNVTQSNPNDPNQPSSPPPSPTPVPLGSPDIKANGLDGPVTVNQGSSATITWGPSGGGTANYSNCWASDNWSGQKNTSGGFVTPANNYGIDTYRTYTINCTNNLTLNTSDAVTLYFKGLNNQPPSASCNLTVSQDSIMVGETATWMSTSTTTERSFYWYGTDNGVAITPVYGGRTNQANIYTYNQPSSIYTRYFKIQSSATAPAECTSNTVSLTVNSVNTPPAGSLSCSASPQNDSSAPYQFTLTLGGTANGYNYNWSGYNGSLCNATPSNDSGGGSGKSVSINCGSNGGPYSATGTESATGRQATCNYSACPDEGCEPPEPDPGALTASINGEWRTICYDARGYEVSCDDENAVESFLSLQGTWQDPLSAGDAPVNNVDFKYDMNASFIYRGDRIDLDCTNDGTVDMTVTRIGSNYNSTRIAFLNACSYASPGTYTAMAKIYKVDETYRTSTFVESDTATIIVTKKIDFAFYNSTWEIPKGTSRYDSKGSAFDYNNDDKMSYEDVPLLQQYSTRRTSFFSRTRGKCPGGKICDFNNDGSLTSADVAAYQDYLNILSIPLNYSGARAQINLTSPTGANVTIGNLPFGSMSVPVVNIPANGTGTTYFNVPNNLNYGSYNITLNGTDTSVTKTNPITLVLNVVNPNPPPTDLSPASYWDIPSTHTTFDARRDYNNDNKMSYADARQLEQYDISDNCPTGKFCDINGDGQFNANDTLSYFSNLQTTLNILKNTPASGVIRLYSNSGVRTTIGNIPNGYTVSPNPVDVPAGSNTISTFTVPSNLAPGTYTVTFSGNITNGSVNSNGLSLRVQDNTPPTVSGVPSINQPNYCVSGPEATVLWGYSDADGDAQAFYQVQIDDQGASFTHCEDSDPNTICEVDSGQISSSGLSYSSGSGKLVFNTTYRARVRVWDSRGAVSSWVVSNSWATPKHAYPQPNFTWAPLNPSPNQPVQFTDQTIFFDGGGVGQRGWLWNFGDGGTAVQQNPSHTYASSDDYIINLTATDKDNYSCATSSTSNPPSQTITVKSSIPIWKEVSPKP